MSERKYTEKLSLALQMVMKLEGHHIMFLSRETGLPRETFYRILRGNQGIQYENGMILRNYLLKKLKNN